MLMQQVQPAFIMAIIASQQAWIILQQSASPLVQAIIIPLGTIFSTGQHSSPGKKKGRHRIL